MGKDDIFYHLGCGNGKGVEIALKEFNVKKGIGIDNDSEKINQARKNKKIFNLKQQMIIS